MAAKWSDNLRLYSWGSFLLFMIAFVFYMVSYVGNEWYVLPRYKQAYPPDSKSIPLTMGLFWMCVFGHCKYDLRIDYMIVRYIPPDPLYLPLISAFQNYRTVCMAIITVGMIFSVLSLAAKLAFLAFKTKYSFLLGFVNAAMEMLAAILGLIGIAIFGSQFRGETKELPFGWCYWLMLAALLILVADAVLTALLSVGLLVGNSKKKSAVTRPLAEGF